MDLEDLLKLGSTVGDALTPDPFSPNPSGGEVDGHIRLGIVRQSGAPFGLMLDELCEHCLLCGRAGAGKTTLLYILLAQLVNLGVPFWAFDFKRDYRHLSRHAEILVFNSKNFRFNPLRPPSGSDPAIWMQSFTNVFCQAFWLLAGTKGVLLKHIEGLYRDYGVFEGSDVYPSMHDLLDSLKGHELKRVFGREAGFLESAINRVEECLLSLGAVFDCDRGFLPEELLRKNVVLELDGLLSENQAFLLTALLRYIFAFRMASGSRGAGLNHVLLFDEAKTVYSKQREFDRSLGVSEVAQFTSMIREFGEGLVVADQMPTELSDSIKSNVFTTICMSQSGGANIAEMGRALGLNTEQVEALRTLQADKRSGVFEAVVKLSGRFMTPFIIRVANISIAKDVSDTELAERVQPLLIALNRKLLPRTEYRYVLEAKKRAELAKVREQGASRQESESERQAVEDNLLIKVLTNIREHPFMDQKTRILMLDLSGSSSTTDKVFKELSSRGLVEVQRLGFGRGKSAKVFYEITDAGRRFASMEKVAIPGKGSFKHKYWQHVIKKHYESLGYTAEIEKQFASKNVDVGFVQDGKKVAVEIELSPDHLTDNVSKDLAAGCERIIICVPNKRSVSVYKKKLSGFDPELEKKVEFKVLSEYLESI